MGLKSGQGQCHQGAGRMSQREGGGKAAHRLGSVPLGGRWEEQLCCCAGRNRWGWRGRRDPREAPVVVRVREDGGPEPASSKGRKVV